MSLNISSYTYTSAIWSWILQYTALICLFTNISLSISLYIPVDLWVVSWNIPEILPSDLFLYISLYLDLGVGSCNIPKILPSDISLYQDMYCISLPISLYIPPDLWVGYYNSTLHHYTNISESCTKIFQQYYQYISLSISLYIPLDLGVGSCNIPAICQWSTNCLTICLWILELGLAICRQYCPQISLYTKISI